ncbi:MAG: hypothetical protein ACREPK_07280, partial [Rhodanobacteraceae bacterium]
QKLKPTTIGKERVWPRRPDSHQTASGIPGAVQRCTFRQVFEAVFIHVSGLREFQPHKRAFIFVGCFWGIAGPNQPILRDTAFIDLVMAGLTTFFPRQSAQLWGVREQ